MFMYSIHKTLYCIQYYICRFKKYPYDFGFNDMGKHIYYIDENI